MADPFWEDFYRDVGILPQLPETLTVDQMYEGIYPASSGLTSRNVESVPINPATGMPYRPSANASGMMGAGVAGGGSGSVTYRPKVTLANERPGPDPVAKYQDRLPSSDPALPSPWDIPSMGMSIAGSGRGGFGPRGSGSGSLTLANAIRPSSADDFVKLSFDPMSDVSGQNMANSTGKPIRTPSGKIFTPSNQPISGVRAPNQPQSARAAPQRGRSLLDMLFGGGGGNTGQGGGISLANAFTSGNGGSSPGPTYTTTPFQEDRFQTTTGAQMPSSMNNSRWTTGY